ncbi:MAG TPA: hypothetical protein VGO40_09700 [Longimicrobium sp.]|jgi:hypothetical protein|nr:hypothetical protein [Longimicrobium sp.]
MRTDDESKDPQAKRESGEPGGGAGRRDEVGGSGVYPASAGHAPLDAEIRTQAAWGQGERGPAGYEDAGSSELFFYEAELRAAEVAEEVRIKADDADESGSSPERERDSA